MNSDDTEWVLFRDPDHGLYYVGEVSVFSDEETVREIVLQNTMVYDNLSGEEKYFAGDVYFSFARESVALEFPHRSPK